MKKNYFWGVFLVLAGAYLVVSQMGYLPHVGVFTLIFTIVCIAALVNGIMNLRFGEILFPLAFIAILYDGPLGITAITPWTVLVAALLGTIGLSMIFGKARKHAHHNHKWKKDWDSGKTEAVEGENITIDATFGAEIRYVTSTDFRYASIDSNFAGVTVYFDTAQIASGNATIDIDSNFGGIELYIPKEWQVINHLNSTFGGVEEKGKRSTEVVATLTLEGSNTFGGITIYYV